MSSVSQDAKTLSLFLSHVSDQNDDVCRIWYEDNQSLSFLVSFININLDYTTTDILI